MLRRSARPVASGRAAMFLETGTDSPVSAASATCSWAASISRASAPTASPAASSSRSPGTSSRAAMACSWPSRSTRTCRAESRRSAAIERFGAPFLVGADQRVHQHDGEDHRRVAPVAHARGQRRRDEQDVDQRALELAQEDQEDRAPGRLGQSVRPVARAALCRRLRRQADRGITAQPPLHRRGIQCMPGGDGVRRTSSHDFSSGRPGATKSKAAQGATGVWPRSRKMAPAIGSISRTVDTPKASAAASRPSWSTAGHPA